VSHIIGEPDEKEVAMKTKVKFSKNAFVTLAASFAVAAVLALPGRAGAVSLTFVQCKSSVRGHPLSIRKQPPQ